MAASGTLAELELHDVQLYDVDDIYDGTISSAFRLVGADNYANPRLPYIVKELHGNTTSGVTGQDGDRLWKRNAAALQSPGWVHDGSAWQQMPPLV